MRLAALLAVALLLGGCATVHTDVRTERGALLRSFGREVPIDERGIAASLEPQWPNLTLALSRFQTCRSEQVEVYSEDVITEKTAPHAAPAIAAGASQAVLGAILYLARGVFSDAPNATVIDANGRYGPSARQVAVGWSAALVGIGVPAVVAGLVELSLTGEKRSTRESEQVAAVRELPCKFEPIDGELEFVSLRSPDSLLLRTQGARATLSAEQLAKVAFESFTLDGKVVQLEPQEREKLDAFESCIHLERTKARLEELNSQELRISLLQARNCAKVPGSDAQVQRIEGLLKTREEQRAREEAEPAAPPAQEEQPAQPPPESQPDQPQPPTPELQPRQ